MNIQSIIDKYGQAVYDAALRQVYINVAMDLFWIGLVLGLWIASIRMFPWLIKTGEEASKKGAYNDDAIPYILTGIALGIFDMIGVVIFLVALTEIVNNLLNPTWAAIHIILSTATGSS
jgi:hypothetical protein